MDPLDLTPVDMECMRCHRTAPMRFYGLCTACRDELHVQFDGGQREIEVAEYVPKMNVTPNAVALKDD
jgi:hypothetical protein